MLASDATLRISEIFFSLQGESSLAGLPTVFIRLTGCPLRCVYCDTAYAFQGGELQTISAILSGLEKYEVEHVCVTGGEPLAQSECKALLRQLCDQGYQVSLETSGAMSVADVDPRVRKIVDMKTPSSGELKKNDYDNLALLGELDEVKFVVNGREDFDWAVRLTSDHALHRTMGSVLISPVYGEQDVQQLADWVLQSALPLRFQMQLHKIIWGDVPGV